MNNPIKVKDITKGQIFTEFDMGTSVICEALEDAQRVDTDGKNGFEFRARVIKYSYWEPEVNTSIQYFESDTAGHYCPKLYID